MFFVFAAMAYWGLLVSLRAASCTRAVGVRLIGYFSSKGSANGGIPALFGLHSCVRVHQYQWPPECPGLLSS